MSQRRKVGRALLAAAWVLISIAVLADWLSPTWSDCPGSGSETGFWLVIFGGLGAAVSTAAATWVLLVGAGGDFRWRLAVVAAGALSAAAVVGVWALFVHHPFIDCGGGNV